MSAHTSLSSYRTYCITGDGETAEGSVWEAASFASYYKLDNLVLIVDVNRLGQSQPAALEHDVETYRKRFDAFGWNAIIVDGHSIEEVCKAFHDAKQCKDKPTCLVAKTFKGESVVVVSNVLGYLRHPLILLIPFCL